MTLVVLLAECDLCDFCMTCYHLVYDTVQYHWIVRVNYSTVVKVTCI